jgi:hypothetical protein
MTPETEEASSVEVACRRRPRLNPWRRQRTGYYAVPALPRRLRPRRLRKRRCHPKSYIAAPASPPIPGSAEVLCAPTGGGHAAGYVQQTGPSADYTRPAPPRGSASPASPAEYYARRLGRRSPQQQYVVQLPALKQGYFAGVRNTPQRSLSAAAVYYDQPGQQYTQQGTGTTGKPSSRRLLIRRSRRTLRKTRHLVLCYLASDVIPLLTNPNPHM